MALSDQLARLAARASEAEVRASGAKAKAKTELEKDVTAAGESAQAQADALSASVDEHGAEVSEWWGNLQRSWSQHTTAICHNIDQKRAGHDFKAPQRNAEQAEADASSLSTTRTGRSRRPSTRCSMPCWPAGTPTRWPRPRGREINQ